MWINLKNKIEGQIERVNLAHVCRAYMTHDVDPELVLVFANGQKVGYDATLLELPATIRGSSDASSSHP